MPIEDALSALDASLAQDSSTPSLGAKDRDSFLDAEREKLRLLAIAPKKVCATTSEWARTHGEFPLKTYEMVAIAGQESSWLLFDPATKLFSLAHGSIDGELELVGFRSGDALTEWRG
jgi:hypothetical protein